MSPSPSNEPRTPNSKKSSAASLLTTFRNLTGGRSRSTVQSSPAPPATVTPVQAAYSRHGQRGQVAEATEIGYPQYASSSKQPANGSGQFGEVLGGPPELQHLIRQLNADNPLPERIAAIHGICPILESYPVSNLLTLWSAAEDLITIRVSDISGADETSAAAYKLLATAVKCSKVSSFERLAFFDVVSTDRNARTLGYRLEALAALTNNGRNVEAIEGSIISLLTNLLQECFEAVCEARKRVNKGEANTAVVEERELSQAFQNIIDLIRFNGKLVRDEETEKLVYQLVIICRKTGTIHDINNSARVIDTMVTYAHVPASCLKDCLALLCDVYRQLSSVEAWAALCNIFRSHMGQFAVQTLLGTLRSGSEDSSSNNALIVRGAFHVLSQLVYADEGEELPRVPIALLISALKGSIPLGGWKHERDALRFIGTMLTNERLKALLLEEEDWTDLLDIVDRCAQRLDPASPPRSTDPENLHVAPLSKVLTGSQDGTEDTTSDEFVRAVCVLREQSSRMDTIHRRSVMKLFMRLGSHLNNSGAEALVDYYADERLLVPSNNDWQRNCRSLFNTFFTDKSRPSYLRKHVIGVLEDAYKIIECLCPFDAINDFASFIIESVTDEEDATVLELLAHFSVNVAVSAPDALFSRVIDILLSFVDRRRASSSIIPSEPNLPLQMTTQAPPVLGSCSNVVTRAIVRMFIRTINKSANKAEALFDALLHIAGSDTCETDARISALKLLFRLRSDSHHAMLVVPNSESESMAAVLCRTVETAVNEESREENNQPRYARPEEHTSSREPRSTSHGPKSRSAKLTRPVPPLWMYPGPSGLPEEPPAVASHLLYSRLDASTEEPTVRRSLKTKVWLELIISLLQQGVDWEVYSYVLVHLGAQLANQSLFDDAVPQIQLLRSVLCEHIRAASFHEPPGYTSLKKADVVVCIYHILTMLVGYHRYFAKSEEDDMIRAFILGIGSWDRTSKWCIHALSVCCHELPLSVSKSLDNALQKMSQIITQQQIAIHILEFLAGLARLPDLYKNFREDDFKMVFGVCFRYLQYARDQREKSLSQKTGQSALRHSGDSRDFTALSETETKSKGRSPGDDLPQYVYALAFHVITFWFLALKLQDRPGYLHWISRSLTYTDTTGKEIIEDQGLVTLDFMLRVAYSDRDETAPDPDFAKPADGRVSERTWIVGLSLMTIQTAGRSGLSQIARRRPSGTWYYIYRPQLTSPPRHQVPLTTGLVADAFYTSSYIGILPDDVLQDFYSPLSLSATAANNSFDWPVALPQDDATRRAISSFDRNAAVDGHKVGVIFIGDGQTTEKEIFANVMGSADYTAFINGLGTLTRLKGAKFNTQGLDREYDTDGEFTFAWRDRVTEIVFHITTMMPTNLDHDPQCTNKKRHTGNDFVNIVFNNSGLPFRFDSFPSAFNYVYIVISPESRASFVDTRHNPPKQDQFYKVQVMSKPGFPDISPAAETKIISGTTLPAFVRLVALNASVFSLVWANREGGEHVSSWRNRLREIRRLRERHCNSTPSGLTSPTPPSTSLSAGSTSGQGLTSPPPRDSGVVFKRASAATFMSEGTSRSSLLSGSTSTEMERQSSEGSRA